MVSSLADALENVALEPGRVYRFQVRGQWIELRVLDQATEAQAIAIVEEGKIDFWVELPLAPVVRHFKAQRGEHPSPDPPFIPPADELPEEERGE